MYLLTYLLIRMSHIVVLVCRSWCRWYLGAFLRRWRRPFVNWWRLMRATSLQFFASFQASRFGWLSFDEWWCLLTIFEHLLSDFPCHRPRIVLNFKTLADVLGVCFESGKKALKSLKFSSSQSHILWNRIKSRQLP